jgi:hypothetical protein
MVSAAESQQVVDLVVAAVFARPNVMHVDKNAVATARHLAAMLVSTQYRSPRRGRYRLRRAGRAFGSGHLVAGCRLGGLRTHVGTAHVLSVTVSHSGDFCRNVDQLLASQLLGALAVLAHAQLDLVIRAAIVGGAAKHVPSHQEQCRVVVERSACITPDSGHYLRKHGQRFARYLEAQHVPMRARVRCVIGQAAGAMTGDESFNLAHAMAPRAFEPGSLCFGRRHARQLAHAGPARGPVAKRLRELRQAFERFGDAQLVLRQARGVAKNPLRVLDEAAIAEPCKDSSHLAAKSQPACRSSCVVIRSQRAARPGLPPC